MRRLERGGERKRERKRDGEGGETEGSGVLFHSDKSICSLTFPFSHIFLASLTQAPAFNCSVTISQGFHSKQNRIHF